jgi:hypothetical protein
VSDFIAIAAGWGLGILAGCIFGFWVGALAVLILTHFFQLFCEDPQ